LTSCRALGPTLVIPKAHARTFSMSTPKTFPVIEVAANLSQVDIFGADGVTQQFSESAAARSFHLHVHVIPRKEESR
jgi:diadenosine tetraphosphate (Ap4A) HIT family hydrolase